MLLVNLSDHPTPRSAEEIQEIKVPIPNVKVTTDGIAAAAKDLVIQVLRAAGTEVIERGEFQVILPGMTPLASVVLALLHGVAGHFPVIRFAVKTETGYVLSDPLDLQLLRVSAREIRE